ncbi:MAG TPA: WecB/TagA/CpsF family glycosyltransferase [Bacteroidota bacterium]|nr:WecB/TagA/CpsF family glycosyltransferase [Bacteroidota bacterium]
MEHPTVHFASVDILGVAIHNLTLDETLRAMTEMALSGQPHHVMTVNPEFVMIAQRDPDFRSVLERATICVADGMGIIWGSRILGRPLKERITGSDTIPAFAHRAAQYGIRIFLLGAAPGVAEETAAILTARNPGLVIAGTFAGSPRAEEEDEICRLIERSRAHVLLVAYGPPKQDLWIARTQSRLRIPLAIGVGGTFDFIAGKVRRAPVWMQKLGLEWLFRLLREPRRWRRMLTLPEFAAAIVREKIFPQPNEIRWSVKRQNQ